MRRRRLPPVGTPADLALRLLGGILVAAVLAFIAYKFGLLFNPLVVVLLAISVVTTRWLLAHFFNAGPAPEWRRPEVFETANTWRVDPRTRRLAGMVSDARPERGTGSRSLAMMMSGLVADRLVRHHGASPDDPLAHAQTYLSPRLWTWIASVNYDRPVPGLDRSTLNAYLKEIDAL